MRTVRKLDLPRQTPAYAVLAQDFPHLEELPIRDYEDAIPRILIENDNEYVTTMLTLRDGWPG